MKRLNVLNGLGAMVALAVFLLTVFGVTAQVIQFADSLNELLFAVASFVLGLILLILTFE